MNTNKTNQANHGLTQQQLDAHWMPFTGNRDFKKILELLSPLKATTIPILTVEKYSTDYRDCGRAVQDTVAQKSLKLLASRQSNSTIRRLFNLVIQNRLSLLIASRSLCRMI